MSVHTWRARAIREGRCIDCGRTRGPERQRCDRCTETHRLQARIWGARRPSRAKRPHPKPLLDAGPDLPDTHFNQTAASIGVREWIELRNEILGGESSAADLAERYGLAERQITRHRAALRAQGLRVRTPKPWECRR